MLDAVADAGAFLIEDDYARDLSIDGDPPPPLAADDPDGHVVYLRSLTKSAAPGLRVAAIGARGPAGARLRAARILDDFFVSGPAAAGRPRVRLRPGLAPAPPPPARRAARAPRRARRPRSAPPAGARPTTLPGGGLHLWVALPDGTDDVALANAAAAEGVVVFPGRPWFPAEPPAPYLRLTYAAAPPDALDEGVRRLARALR